MGLNEATAQEAQEEAMRFWWHPPTHHTEGPHGQPKARPGIPGEGRTVLRLNAALGTPQGHPVSGVTRTKEEAYWQEVSRFSSFPLYGMLGQRSIFLHV